MGQNSFALIIFLIFTTTNIECFLIPVFNSNTASVLCVESKMDEMQGRLLKVCPVSVKNLRNGRQEFGIHGDYWSEFPDWVNTTLATIGQKYAMRNYVGFLYSTLLGTVFSGASVDARRVALSSGTITVKNGARRFLGNLLHFRLWLTSDLNLKSEPSNKYLNQSIFIESLNLLRTIHEKSAHQTYQFTQQLEKPVVSQDKESWVLNEPLWDALKKDLTASKFGKLRHRQIFPRRDGGTSNYFNQYGMTLQIWASLAPPLLNPRASLFANPTDEEALGYMHLWGIVAHGLGLKPEYNIAFQPNLRVAKEYLQSFMEEYFIPELFNLDYETKLTIEIYIFAISKSYPIFDLSLLLVQMAEDILQIQTKNLRRVMSPQSRIYKPIMSITRLNLDLFGYVPAVNFLMSGMQQVATQKYVGFNILDPKELANGLVEYDEKLLDKTNMWLLINNTSLSRS